ncbi:LAME_0H11540g1_1 [Lachancea meyersii CBS 8951]|uniref:Endopolyphosphatase n=1 Tax=Lachancea meyersii CBS 8951 TaxID=1266667 RepID=A0A1G4KGL0_9SACH|nr:LAME_0H11540g1_1 [Lachancea meyersii CBS 8951]
MPEKARLGEAMHQGRHKRLAGILIGVVVGISLLFVACYRKFPVWSMFLSEDITSNTLVENVSQTADVEQLAALGLSTDTPVKIIQLSGGKSKTLRGRFLHITDIHPDPFYKTGTSVAQMCHRGKPEDKSDRAPRFGTAMNGCDSSMDLMEYTLKWVEDNLRDQIDFVVWTGDNIRHDNDRRNPRTESQIFDLNAQMAQRFEKIFRNPDNIDPRDFDVEVIPSLGNNDVFPHNLFSLGPTLQTRELTNMWSNFVPQEQQRAFARGTSYFVEVIPGKLAVLSIETLYLYKANPLVDTCNSKKEPGYQLLLWLGYVLEELRSRNMKVWLTGHVPPLPKNYDGNCFHKYTLWTNEYRDIIIGGLYGHMNIDHFIPLDAKKSWKAIEKSNSKAFNEKKNGEFGDDDDSDDVLDSAVEASDARIMGAKPVNKVAYIEKVRETYYNKIASKASSFASRRSRKKHKNKNKNDKNNKKPTHYKGKVDRYSIVTVAGSVIPTFNPAFRVWEYNISGLESSCSTNAMHTQEWGTFFDNLETKIEQDLMEEENTFGWAGALWRSGKIDKTIPSRMPTDLPLGPAYTPQLFTPTRFVQYYADLKDIERKYSQALDDGLNEEEAAAKAFAYQVEYSSDDAPYPMKSLLTKDYIDLAVELAYNETLWTKFTERAFLSSGYDD